MAEEHTKASYIIGKWVIIEFALASIVRLVAAASPGEFTGKTTLLSCRSGWEHNREVEVSDSIDQMAFTSKCSPHSVLLMAIDTPEMID